MIHKEFQEFAGWLKDEIYKVEKDAKDNCLDFDYEINTPCNYFEAYSDIYEHIEHYHSTSSTETLEDLAEWLKDELNYYKANRNNTYIVFYEDPAGKWTDYVEAYENALNELNREINERRTNGIHKS